MEEKKMKKLFVLFIVALMGLANNTCAMSESVVPRNQKTLSLREEREAAARLRRERAARERELARLQRLQVERDRRVERRLDFDEFDQGEKVGSVNFDL